MWEAGNPDKTLASRTYLNWDCSTGELCVLVKAEPDYSFRSDASWFKNYPDGSFDQVPIGGSVTNIFDTDGNIVGWEGCYSMLAACSNAAQFHANFDNIGSTGERTTSTGKNANPIALDLTCPCTGNSDCVINACYDPSICVEKTTCTLDGASCAGGVTGTTGVCEYGLAYDNCCTVNEDCGIGFTCNGISEGTGTCQASSPTPTPAGPTAPSTPVPPPTGPSITPPTNSGGEEPVVDECTIATVADNCTLAVDQHPDCATPVCNINDDVANPNTCGVEPQNADGPCGKDTPPDEVDNDCYAPVCNGVACVDAWKPAGQVCTYPSASEDPNWDKDSCVEFKCQSANATSTKTTCEPVYKPATTLCGPAPESRGPCDSGNKCNPENGYCSDVNSFKSSDTLCRASAEGKTCDKPEYCTGINYECPPDVNYAAEDNFVCRAECDDGNCLDDVAEMCPGGDVDVCPADIIFQKTISILAGQHYNAGNTTITATVTGESTVQVCVDIILDDDWMLQTSEEAVKLEINTLAPPKSAPGSYSYKYADIDAMAGENCFTFDTSEVCTVYFALHLDVVGPEGNTETAWAKTTDADAATTGETSLMESGFVKPGTSKGPKVKSSTTGWGSYFSFSICCANVDSCDAPVGGGGGSGEGGDGGEGSADDWTCSNGVSQLTCYPAVTANEEVTCSSLFA
jgi:hypothetical protein